MKIVSKNEEWIFILSLIIVTVILTHLSIASVNSGMSELVLLWGVVEFFIIVIAWAFGKYSDNKNMDKFIGKKYKIFSYIVNISFLLLIFVSYYDGNYVKTNDAFDNASSELIRFDSAISKEYSIPSEPINLIKFYKNINFLLPKDVKIIMTYKYHNALDKEKYEQAVAKSYFYSVANKEPAKSVELSPLLKYPQKEANILLFEKWAFIIICLLKISEFIYLSVLAFMSKYKIVKIE